MNLAALPARGSMDAAAAARAGAPRLLDPHRPLQVNLGDSFSSGMGSEATPTSTGTLVDMEVYGDTAFGSWQSTRSAARLLASSHGFQLRDASYAGSTTDALLGAGIHGHPPQLDAVTRDAHLVTLTIGGNDARLLDLATAALHNDHAMVARTRAVAERRMQALAPRIADVLAEIVDRAPSAQVRIAGYPHLFQAPELMLAQDRLNDIVRGAAAASGPRVRYVDPHGPGSPFTATDEHGPRDMRSPSPERWINGVHDRASGAFAMHPNRLGNEHYARLYAESLSSSGTHSSSAPG